MNGELAVEMKTSCNVFINVFTLGLCGNLLPQMAIWRTAVFGIKQNYTAYCAQEPPQIKKNYNYKIFFILLVI